MDHGRVTKPIAAGLVALRERVAAAQIPPSSLDESLNVATWNIREFGRRRRTTAAIHYLAEILSPFDLVGLVELREDLSDLQRVLPILGPHWRALYSDAILDRGGNRERVAYLYDSRAVEFTGLAATATEPRKKRGLEYLPEASFWRKPFLASFRAGSFDFVVLTTHVRWGESVEARRAELERLADWIEAKRRSDGNEDKDWIVMGDFNIPKRGDRLFQAITRHGLQVPDALRGTHGTNLEKDKRYDQILHDARRGAVVATAGGVLDWFVDDAHAAALFPGLARPALTYQVSDHLPLWVQLRTAL